MRLTIENFGPIKHADLTTGDLTVLVGPQATGKTLVTELFKLIFDFRFIKRNMIDKGYDPRKEKNQEYFLDFYFGEGMSKCWNDQTRISYSENGKSLKEFDYQTIVNASFSNEEKRIFYIPAQRVTLFEAGWPRRFHLFDSQYSYVTREFGESLFFILDNTFSKSKSDLFPNSKFLKKPIKEKLSSSIYYNSVIKLARDGIKKRLILQISDAVQIPMPVWSTGQREFTPLLIGLYELLPATAKDKLPHVHTVIIEEPEMGLHPKAILSFMLTVFELMSRGYSVILSTHSATVLEVLWGIKHIQKSQMQNELTHRMFGLKKNQQTTEITDSIKGMELKAYYFEPARDGTVIKDISDLNPFAEDSEATWGGLTEFTQTVSDIVSEIYSESADE